MQRIVTLLTDFGHQDAYVGIMKGVIASIHRDVQMIDLCHSIPPQDIQRGAFTLWSAVDVFPPGTIHVVVVDPGVGSARKAIVIEAGGQKFVGPDNGVLWAACDRFHIRCVTELNDDSWFREEVSSTFHGRDIFASVGGFLAKGVSTQELGSKLDAPVKLELFDAIQTRLQWQGRVLHADRFGNWVTNIPARWLEEVEEGRRNKIRTYAGTHFLDGVFATFSDVAGGQPLVYPNSFGLLEIGVRNGSAVETLSLASGDSVRVVLPQES